MQKKIKELDKTEVIQIYVPHKTVSMTKTVTINFNFFRCLPSHYWPMF